MVENNQQMESYSIKNKGLVQEKEALMQQDRYMRSSIEGLQGDLAQAIQINKKQDESIDEVRQQLAAKTIQYEHIKQRLDSYQTMYNTTMLKQEQVIEKIKKQRNVTMENKDKFDFLLQTNKQLKEKLRDQENENARLKTQIKAFEQINEKAKLCLQRINNLEMENDNLKVNLEMERNQIQQLQSIIHKRENTIKQQKENIDKLQQSTSILQILSIRPADQHMCSSTSQVRL